MEEGNETDGKLIMLKTKRQRTCGRDKVKERKGLNELPDCVLLHIIQFLETREAIKTCVLSKRWKNLWKLQTNLAFNTWEFSRISYFDRFVSQVLSNREHSISLLNLDFNRRGIAAPRLLNRVVKYAVLHNVQQFAIHVNCRQELDINRFIFFCRSLTVLKLSINCYDPLTIKLPKSLRLPALKRLHLVCVNFTATDHECPEPFSTCGMLNTLVLENCSLHNVANTLYISNSKLSSLSLLGPFRSFGEEAYKIVLSTPNLSSLTIMGWDNHVLSPMCNLPFLEEVNIDSMLHPTNLLKPGFRNLNWLHVLANVKRMTMSSSTLELILDDLSNPVGSMRIQPPCLAKLESFKMELKPHSTISEEGVNKIVKYLLQNSPLARVDVRSYMHY